MSKTDYNKLLKQYAEMLKEQPSLSVQAFCELVAVPYSTAKRYLSKKKALATVTTAIEAGAEQEEAAATGKKAHNWHLLLKEFLAQATANPKLSINKFAQLKGVNPATCRRQFKDMRSLPQFDQLWDLYDEQRAKLSVINSSTRSAATGKIIDSHQGRHTRANVRLNAILEKKSQKVAPENANNAKIAQVTITSADVAQPLLHTPYYELSGLSSRILEAVTQIDPLSVNPELTLARANLLEMYQDYQGKLNHLMELKASGEPLMSDDGEDELNIDREIDRVRYGFAPRIREAEMSITQMTKAENKRYLELRKLEQAELMTPHVLPARQQEIVMEMLADRETKNWSAHETCKNIELLGAVPPATLLHEMKLELANLEPEVDDSGVSEEELDAQFEEYQEEHQQEVDHWVAERREEIAAKIKEAEDKENGLSQEQPEIPTSQLQASAETEEAYNELDGFASELFDASDFEVLDGDKDKEHTE